MIFSIWLSSFWKAVSWITWRQWCSLVLSNPTTKFKELLLTKAKAESVFFISKKVLSGRSSSDLQQQNSACVKTEQKSFRKTMFWTVSEFPQFIWNKATEMQCWSQKKTKNFWIIFWTIHHNVWNLISFEKPEFLQCSHTLQKVPQRRTKKKNTVSFHTPSSHSSISQHLKTAVPG